MIALLTDNLRSPNIAQSALMDLKSFFNICRWPSFTLQQNPFLSRLFLVYVLDLSEWFALLQPYIQM